MINFVSFHLIKNFKKKLFIFIISAISHNSLLTINYFSGKISNIIYTSLGNKIHTIYI
jgi:hypothetical protein